jgi:hypothetical protein
VTDPTATPAATKPVATTPTAVKPTPDKPTSCQSTAVQHTADTPDSRDTPDTPAWQSKTINSTHVLNTGDSVASDRMRITMRHSGSLVISDEHGVIRWSSHTQGHLNHAVFQDDGHLVVYNQANQPVWSSGTAGNPGSRLVIQSDGDVIITAPSGAHLWASGTAH